jgi:hypothetical protein
MYAQVNQRSGDSASALGSVVSEASRVGADRDRFAVVVVDVDGVSFAVRRMVLGVEVFTVFAGEHVQPKRHVVVRRALDDANTVPFQLGSDFGGVVGDVTFPLRSHESLTDRSASDDLHESGIGLRVIGEARYPGRLFQ